MANARGFFYRATAKSLPERDREFGRIPIARVISAAGIFRGTGGACTVCKKMVRSY